MVRSKTVEFWIEILQRRWISLLLLKFVLCWLFQFEFFFFYWPLSIVFTEFGEWKKTTRVLLVWQSSRTTRGMGSGIRGMSLAHSVAIRRRPRLEIGSHVTVPYGSGAVWCDRRAVLEPLTSSGHEQHVTIINVSVVFFSLHFEFSKSNFFSSSLLLLLHCLLFTLLLPFSINLASNLLKCRLFVGLDAAMPRFPVCPTFLEIDNKNRFELWKHKFNLPFCLNKHEKMKKKTVFFKNNWTNVLY